MFIRQQPGSRKSTDIKEVKHYSQKFTYFQKWKVRTVFYLACHICPRTNLEAGVEELRDLSNSVRL